MTGTLITIASFIFVLGVLVFVHELGHFWAAKRVGIRVLKFQLGFDPTVASIRRGDTEYSLGILPLGGYVKFHGDANGASAPDLDALENMPETERAVTFAAQPLWARAAIVFAGTFAAVAQANS